MSVIAELRNTARADVQVLQALADQGDDFSVVREVDFLLRAPGREEAELVAGFINDHGYGRASAYSDNGQHCVAVLVDMPVQQNAILSVSGFMVCLCQLYGLEYDGWGCEAQVRV